MKKLTVLVAALVLTSISARAAHAWEDTGAWWGGHFKYDRDTTEHYFANEVTLDTFASFVAPERKFADLFETNIRRGKWGGGVGVNYFFTREIGIGTDMNMADNDGNLVDHVAASLILRWPFEPSGVAPYIFGGGARRTDPTWEWLGNAGVGVEWRFNPTTGIFVDGRYIWADKTFESVLLRTGLRFAF